jgi:hypothetical protein
VLLKEFADCFAWCYTEMLGLSKELVEHRLPIKKGFKPYQQPVRSFCNTPGVTVFLQYLL